MSQKLQIFARPRWNDTGLDVTEGERVIARSVSGHWIDGGVGSDALGFEKPWLTPWKWTRRCREARWFELVAVVGRFDGPYHLIARDGSFVAERAGRVYLFANDAWIMYWNNSGALEVELEKASAA
jgi:hypothetical protein